MQNGMVSVVDGETVEEYKARIAATYGTPARVIPQTHEESIAMGVDAEGAARVAEQRKLAESSGFALGQELYTPGTRLIQAGLEVISQRRQAVAAMPFMKEDAIPGLITRVQAEKRTDVILPTAQLRMAESGMLVTQPTGARYALTPRGFAALVTRLGCGGAEYLRDSCTPKLRAININHQCVAQPKDNEIKLRTRNGSDVFAVVSPTYTAHDIDAVAAQVMRGIPDGMHGSIVYDPNKGRWRMEAIAEDTLEPAKHVAGEVFRIGLLISGDDTGGGSINVSSFVHQGLCLNEIITHIATLDTGRFIHKGAQRSIASGIAVAISEATESIAGFMTQWNRAAAESVVTAEQIAVGRQIAAMNVFRGILDREMVKVPGRTEDIVKGLSIAFAEDTSSAVATVGVSRAAVVNAFTRYAHTNVGDPWISDAISRDAGKILASSKPLPFLELEAA